VARLIIIFDFMFLCCFTGMAVVFYANILSPPDYGRIMGPKINMNCLS
jgi:hypothetical protein